MKRICSLLFTLTMLFAMAMTPLRALADTNPNLIANPTVSTQLAGSPTNWTSGSWGTNTTTFNYVTTSGHGDTTSLSATMSGHTSGDAKWTPDAAAVTAGQSYTYSDWYIANVATELDAQYTDTSGTVSYGYLGSAPASGTWKQMSAIFVIPANITKLSVLHVLYANGSLQTDDFSLTTTVVAPPPTDGNLIANPSFATANGTQPAGWSSGAWGTNTAQFTYNSNLGHTDSTSASVSMTSYTSGDAKWYANPVAIVAGQSYTYSDWYQSSVVTTVVAAFIDSAGNYTYATLNAAAPSSSWVQYSANLVAPATAKQIVMLHLLSAVGSLTIDDANLTATPPTQNLVPNPSVETVNPSQTSSPLNWQASKWGTNTTTFQYLKTGGHTGNRAVQVKISKYTSGDAKWTFSPVAVTAHTQYRFSDWYEATVTSQVVMAFDMSDGSTTYELVGLPDVTAANTWTNFSTTFSVPLGAQTMTAFHLLNSIGTLTIDDVGLTAHSPVGFNRALVTLTFDDGYADIYTNGLPLLQKYGFKSTQFIISGFVNTPTYMTTAQVQAFYQAGNEIGSHTVSHPNMLTLTSSQQTAELSNSKTQLQQWIGAPVTDFAFPEGLYSGPIIAKAKQYYGSTRGVEAGYNSKDTFNAYDIKVQDVDGSTTAAQYAEWIAQAQATKTWLVLVYHEVNTDTTTSPYTVTPTQLDSQLSALQTAGVAVVTLQQALAEITPQL